MKLQGTLRRTLAMLLVLIFALSNMGLAEVAEQVADSVPAVEPSIEETAADETGDEADVPDEEEDPAAPVAPAFEAEAEAAPVAESVSVEVLATDEHTLCAYETIEPEGNYEVSYMWERAESADGEWTVLDETSDVLVSEAEDRAEYVYRCTVTVGDVTATSAPATYNWGVDPNAEPEAEPEEEPAEEAPALIDLGADFGIAELGEALKQPSVSKDSSTSYGVLIAGSTQTSIKLIASNADEEVDHYEWTVEPSTVFDITYPEEDDTTKHAKPTFTLKSDANLGTIETGTSVSITCIAAAAEPGSESPASEAITLTLLPALPDTISAEIKVIPKNEGDAKNAVESLMQSKSANIAYKAILPGVNAGYGIAWSIDDETDKKFATIGGSDGTINVAAYGVETGNGFTGDNKNGEEVTITAKVGLAGSQKDVTGKVTILPAATGVEVTVNGTKYESTAIPVRALQDVELSGKLISTDFPDIADLKFFGSDEGIKWSVKKGETEGSAFGTPGSGDEYTFKPDNETATYVITAQPVNTAYAAVKTEAKVTATKLSDKVEAVQSEITFIEDSVETKNLEVEFSTNGEADNSGTYQTVEWAIDSTTNTWATGQTFIKHESGAATGKTYSVQLTEDTGRGTEANGGPVKVTAKTWVAENGVATQKTIEFKVNVVPNSVRALTADDIKFTDNTIEIGQPITKGTSDPDWSKTTAYVDNAAYDLYEIEWTADGANASYVDVNRATGEIRAKAQTGENVSKINEKAGLKVEIKASVKGVDPENSAKKEITIYPQVNTIYIGHASKTGTDAAVDVWYGANHEADDKGTETLPVSSTAMNLMVTLQRPGETDDPKPYGNVTKVTYQKVEDGEPVGEPSNNLWKANNNNIVTIPTSVCGAPGTYQIYAETTIGDSRTLTLTFVNEATSVKLTSTSGLTGEALVDEPDLSTTVFTAGESASDHAKTVIYGYAVDKDGNLAYEDTDIEWHLAVSTESDSVTATQIVQDVVTTSAGSDNDSKIFLTGTLEDGCASTVTLNIGKDFELKAGSATASFTLLAWPKGNQPAKKEFTFTVKAKPEENLFSGIEIKFDPADASNQQIVQGETVTLDLVDSTPADDNNPLTGLTNYPVVYTVTINDDDSTSLVDTTKDDWIEIKQNKGETKATLSAFKAGTKNTIPDAKKSDGLKFDVKVSVDGYNEEDAPKLTETVTLVAAPKSVDISMATKRAGGSGAGSYQYSDAAGKKIPLALPYNTEIYMKPVLHEEDGYKAITRKPTMSVDNTNLATIEQAVTKDKTETAAAEKSDTYWTLKANTVGRSGTVKVTASWGDVSKTVEIKIIAETIQPAEGQEATCASSPSNPNSGRNHVWTLETTAVSPTAYGIHADDKGHYYKCAYCDVTSKPVAHANFKVILKDETKKTEDVLWFDPDESDDSDAGIIGCDICGYACPHTGYNDDATVKPVRDPVGDYHTATCPICKQVLKQKHIDDDKDNQCDRCDGSTSAVVLKNADKNFAIVDGANFVPNFQISNADTWDASFAPAAGDAQYITVDARTGEVTAKGVKSNGEPAKVTAEFTVTSNPKPDKTYTGKFTYEYEVNLRNATGKIAVTADAANMSGDKAWVIGGKAIKLTATPANSNPYLEGFEWKLPADASSAGVSFVKEKADGTPDTSSSGTIGATDKDATTGELLLHKTSIWLYATAATEKLGDDALTVTYEGTDSKAEKGEIKVEILKPLTEDADTTDENVSESAITDAITFEGEETKPTNAYTIIEGERVGVSLQKWDADRNTATPFDTRYGSVTFTVKPDSTASIDAKDTSKWIQVKSGNTVETYKGQLTASDTDGKTFTIFATVVIGQETGADGKTKNIVATGKRSITIKRAPTKITATYAEGEAAGATLPLPTAGLSFYEDAKFTLAATTDSDDANEIENGLTWTVTPASAVKVEKAEDYPHTYTIQRGAGDFEIAIRGFGLETKVPVKVKKQITDFNITVTNPKVAIGEVDTTAEGEKKSKTISVKVEKVPADSPDDYTLHAYLVKDEGTGEAQKAVADTTKEITGMFTESATKGTWVYQVPTANSNDPRNTGLSWPGTDARIMIVAEATDSKTAPVAGKDQEQVTKGELIELYKYPTNDSALKLTTSKESLGGTSLVLTKGASVKITEAGYDTANGYGASTGATLPVEITDTGKLNGEATASPIITLVGDTLTAVGEGEAEIAVKSPINESAVKTLKITIEPEIDPVIEIDESRVAETEKLKDTYDIPKGSSFTINKGIFKAYRTTELLGKQEVPSTQVKFELTAAKTGIVEIKDDTDKWTVKGAEVGSTELYVAVGTAQSKHITVNVQSTPTGIIFTDGDGKTYENGAQIRKIAGQDTAPITLTASAVPETAGGTITLDVTGTSLTGTPEGAKVTVTPVAGAIGATRITAMIPLGDDTDGDSPTDPKYLRSYVEVVMMGEEESTEPPADTAVEIVGKKAIGPGEETVVSATGVETGTEIKWSSDSEAVTVTAKSGDPMSATVTYPADAAAGKAVITATTASGTLIGTKTIYLLTAPTEIALSRATEGTMTIAIGEVLELNADIAEGGGYAIKSSVAAEAEVDGIIPDTAGLFSYSPNNTKALTVTNSNGKVTVKANSKPGKKDAAPMLTIKTIGMASDTNIAVNIVGKNTGFTLPDVNGSTLYMTPDESKDIAVTYNPASSPANLAFDIYDSYGIPVFNGEDLTLTQTLTGINLKVAADASTDEEAIYRVVVSAEGYTDHAEQSFTVVVQDEATESETLAIAVRKVGTVGTGYGDDAATESVTVVKGEKLQAYFVDNGKPVAGNISWTAQTNADKKKAEISATGLINVKGATGTVTISGSVNGITAKPITLTLAKQPKVTLDPNVTTKTVAIGEEFQMGLKLDPAYPDTKADEFYTVSWTDDLGVERVIDEETPNLWKFNEPGITTATLQPLWGGKAKTVKFTVLEEEVATSFDVPEEVFVAEGAKTIVRAEMDGYVNLSWLNGADPITNKDKATTDKKIKVKTLSNSEVQITAAKGAVGAEISVKALGDAEAKKIKITVKPASTQFPAETKLVFEKPVITVGESTIVGLDFGADEAPVGDITYKFQSVKGAGKVSIKNNVVTAKAPGIATVVAQLGKDKNAVKTGTIYVLPKATIQTNLNPTKMGAYERLTMGVTITDYVAKNVPDPELQDQVNTVGMLTVESNSSNIEAWLDAVEGTTNKYELTLQAGDAEKNAKGKFLTTTITLRLSNGQKKVMKIQVVEAANEVEVFVPESITIAPQTSVKLVEAIAEGAAYAANYNWHFADATSEQLAEEHLLTLADGKLTAARGATPTGADEVIEVVGSYDGEEKTIEVTIAAAKAGKDQFEIVRPNRTTVYIGEKIPAKLKYDANVGGGDITWKTSAAKIVSVDKTTGLYTVIGPVGKKANISATVNGKSSSRAKIPLIVADAPARMAFSKSEIQVEAGSNTEYLTKYLTIDGSALESSKDYYPAVRFSTDSDLVTVDANTGKITVPATTTEGTALVKATSFNGLIAHALIVIGKGSGGTTPEPDYVPAHVELQMNGIDLSTYTQRNPLVIDEDDVFDIKAVVTDSTGISFTPKTAVVWGPANNTNVKVEGTGLNGKITALKATNSEHPGYHDFVEVTVSVATESGTPVSGSFYVQVNYKLREENVKVEFTPSALLMGDTDGSKAVFAITVPELQTEWTTKIEVEAKNLTENIITLAPGGDKDSGWTVTPVAPGKGSIQFTVKDTSATEAKELFSFTKDIMVNDLPKASEIKIVDAEGKDITNGTMTLGEFEPGAFEIVMPASFNGEPAQTDVGVTVRGLTLDSKGEYPPQVAAGTIDNQEKTAADGSKTDEILKYTVTGIAKETYPKFRVQVQLYANETGSLTDAEPIIAAFTVELKDSPKAAADFVVEATPDFTSDTSKEINVGVNEPVSISAALAEGKTWTQGVVWTWANENDYASVDAAKKPDVDLSTPGVAKVTIKDATVGKTDELGWVKLTLGLKGDVEVVSTHSPVLTVDYTIKAAALPTKASDATIVPVVDHTLDGAGTFENPYVIGQNEMAEFKVNYGNANAAYSTNVRWDKGTTTKIGLSDTTGLTTTVSGVSTTDGAVALQAFVGDVQLGSDVYFKVVAAPTDATFALVDSGTAAFSKTWDGNASKQVTVDLGDASATCELVANNEWIKLTKDPNNKNTWTFGWYTKGDEGAPTTTPPSSVSSETPLNVTLTLTSKDNNLIKRYNISITGTPSAGFGT